ncbi:MAG: hypothetical protein H6623_05380 [Bdellovibrionaceae bacterium]|nr:hypothetical protein [Pseudobdellovibrionaceae bacterium]
MKATKPRKRKFKGTKVTTSLRLPEDLVKYYEKLAEELGRNFSEVVVEVLDETADSWEKDSKSKK